MGGRECTWGVLFKPVREPVQRICERLGAQKASSGCGNWKRVPPQSYLRQRFTADDTWWFHLVYPSRLKLHHSYTVSVALRRTTIGYSNSTLGTCVSKVRSNNDGAVHWCHFQLAIDSADTVFMALSLWGRAAVEKVYALYFPRWWMYRYCLEWADASIGGYGARRRSTCKVVAAGEGALGADL